MQSAQKCDTKVFPSRGEGYVRARKLKSSNIFGAKNVGQENLSSPKNISLSTGFFFGGKTDSSVSQLIVKWLESGSPTLFFFNDDPHYRHDFGKGRPVERYKKNERPIYNAARRGQLYKGREA